MAFSGLIDAILGEVNSTTSASEIESIAASAAQAVEDYATLTLYPWLEEREQSYDGLLEIFTLSGEAVLKTAAGRDAEDPDQRLRSILYQLEAEIGDVLGGRAGISA